MHIRVVNYFGPDGGITRFTLEMIKGLLHHEGVIVDFLSHGPALEAHQRLLQSHHLPVEGREAAPANLRAIRMPKRTLGIKGTARLKRMMRMAGDYFYVVPGSALDDCDVAWFPMAHRHVVDDAHSSKVLGTLHDLTFSNFEEEMKVDAMPEEAIRQEEATFQQWLSSDARLVTTSETSRRSIEDRFGTGTDRLSVVPILAAHVPGPRADAIPANWTWAHRPFVIYPATFSPHKNHEVLLRALAKSDVPLPLVLTGAFSDLPASHPRGAKLWQLAEREGLEIRSSLFPLGHVSDETYYALLSRAHAMVFPSLGEGGGSFPVLEAMLYGIPVVCSDIPVMREQLSRTGGEVLWFDPRSISDLILQLHKLEENYDLYKRQAIEQIPKLKVRSWSEVAEDYLSIMRPMLPSEACQPVGASPGELER